MKTENSKLKIIFFGTPLFVVPILEALLEHFDVVGIATTPDVKIGRKKILTGTPVKLAYQSYLKKTKRDGLIINSTEFTKNTIEQLSNLQPDLFVVAAYGQLIPKKLLDIPKYGSLNIHPSLLPKYRGPSPIQTTILKGESKTGVTIIRMDEKIDHGPIVIREELPLSPHDTFESLHVKLFVFAAEMLPRVIKNYVSGKIKPKPQNHKKATHCEHITRSDGYFSLDNPPDKKTLDRMIRAYHPWPSAWTRWKGKIVKLLPDKRMQIEGKSATTQKDFFNGHPSAKEVFEPLLK